MKHKKLFSSLRECKKLIAGYFGDYLTEHPEEIADIESLADYLGCTRRDILALERDPLFGEQIRLAKNRIARIKKQLAMKGKIPAAVLSFDLKNNHDYTDKGETTEDTGTTVIISGDAGKWTE